MGFFKNLGKAVKKVVPILGTVASVATGNPLFAIAGNAAGAIGPGGGTIRDVALNAAGTLGGSALLGSGGFMDGLTRPFTGLGGDLGKLGTMLGGGSAANPLNALMRGGSTYAPGSIGVGDLAPGIAPQGGTIIDTARGLPWQTGNTIPNGGNLLSQLGSAISNNPLQAIGAALALHNSLSPDLKGATTQQQVQDQIAAQKAQDERTNQNVLASLNSPGLDRHQVTPQIDYYHYGQRPEQSFFDTVKPAQATVPFAKGGGVKPLSGRADTVPARLSVGEYVIPADVVAHLGDGNTGGGAKQLDAMVKNVRTQKQAGGKLPPPARNPLAYIGAAA
jgi:hypothetical protein